MARNNGQKRFLEMDPRTKHKHLAAVHETVEALPGVDKGFGRNPVHVVGADGRKRAVCDLYVVLEDGRVFEVERVPTSPSSIRRAVAGFRDVELPGLGPAIKVSRTSRSNPRILKSFLERGYNFLVRGVLRYATFPDEKQARQFDRRVLEATAPWTIEVGPEIQGNTEFRDYYQLTRIDEAFRALQKALPKGPPATAVEPKTPEQAVPRPVVEKVDLALDEAFGDDEVVCLVCGAAFRTLARHLRTAHRLTAAQYRCRFHIPDAIPLTSKKYSKLRRTIASKPRTVAS